MKKYIKIIVIASLIIIAAAIIIGVFVNRRGIDLPENSNTISAKGITFENMGENFIFSSDKRKKLEKKFGNDVLESWTPLLFDDFSQDFLKKHLEEIFKISKKLENTDLKEKSGKNSIKIKYPYVQKNTAIFKEIHLSFSGLTKNPLIFKISSYEYENLIKSLYEKFSDPQKITFDGKEYFFWKKDNSVMIAEIKKDRFNKPYLSIVIYYLENLINFFNSTDIKNEKSIENIF
jgi:hypothetical protein